MSAMTSPLRTRELKSALSLAMLPEPWDPTWTVITALTVPVASTTSRISPRCTFAVRWASGGPPWRSSATTTAATTAPPAAGSQSLRRGRRAGGRRAGAGAAAASLIAQGVDRIEERGLARRVVAEEHSDRDRDEGREHHRLGRHLHRPAERAADEERSRDPQQHARGAADQAEHHGLAEELDLDRFLRRAHRHAHADL